MSDVMAISFNSMNEAKINLNRAREACENTKNKLNSAISKLQVDSSSARLRQSQDSIRAQISRVNTRIGNINKVVAGIDYAVKRFHEVDNKCASRIKGAVNEYSKKNSKQSTIQKFGNFCGSLVDDGKKAWSNISNKLDSTKKTIKKWSHNGADFVGGNWKDITFITLDGVAIVCSAVLIAGAIVGTAPVSVPILIALGIGIVFSASNIGEEGSKIYSKETIGKDGNGFNFLEEGFKEVAKGIGVDEKYGEYSYNAANIITTFGPAGLGVSKSLIKSSELFFTMEKASQEAANAVALAKEIRYAASAENRRLTHSEIDKIAHNKYITKRALETGKYAFNKSRIESVKEIGKSVWEINKPKIIVESIEKSIEFVNDKVRLASEQ